VVSVCQSNTGPVWDELGQRSVFCFVFVLEFWFSIYKKPKKRKSLFIWGEPSRLSGPARFVEISGQIENSVRKNDKFSIPLCRDLGWKCRDLGKGGSKWISHVNTTKNSCLTRFTGLSHLHINTRSRQSGLARLTGLARLI